MKNLLVNLKDVAKAPVGSHAEIKINEIIDSPDKEKLTVSTPLIGNIKFTNFEKQIAAEFNLSLKIKLICFRCGEVFSKKNNLIFKKTYKLSDLNAHQNLNILPAIYEEIILSIPIQPLCKKTCKGRCQKCGQNLNIKKCQCEKTTSSRNYPLASLRKLL